MSFWLYYMSKHYSPCRVLSIVLPFFCNIAYAQSTGADSKSGQATRSSIVKVATYANPSVKTLDESTPNPGARGLGATKIYAADVLNADWKTQSGSFSCTLTHHIQGFGNAVFSRKTGSGEIFYLTPQGSVVFPRGSASIDTLPPAWRGDATPVHLGDVTAVTGDKPVKLAPTEFAPMLSQLSGETKVMFTSATLADTAQNPSSTGVGAMRVVLDPKNFSAAYKSYQQCMEVLIPYTFAQVSYLSLNYSEKAEGLNTANKTELNKVARYVKADPAVLGVLIDAHSDNQGSPEENEAISKQESEWVTAYLVLQGVDADKIKARWHGDKFPLADNKTESGRSQNRRVTVRLENEETRLAAQERAAVRMAAEERAALKAAAEKKKEELAAAEAAEKAKAEALAKEQEELAKAELAKKSKKTAKPQHISTKMAPKESTEYSSNGKVTPEQISKMVNGLELVPQQ